MTVTLTPTEVLAVFGVLLALIMVCSSPPRLGWKDFIATP